MTTKFIEAPEQVGVLFRHTNISVLGNALGVLIVTINYWGGISEARIVAWCIAIGLVLTARWGCHYVFVRNGPVSAASAHRWGKVWLGGVLLTALAWSGAGLTFTGLVEGHRRDMVLLLITFGISIGSISLLAPYPWVFRSYIGLTVLPTAISISLNGGIDELWILLVVLAVIAASIGMASRFREVYNETISLKVEAEQLVREIRLEKEASTLAKAAEENAVRINNRVLGALAEELRRPIDIALEHIAGDRGGDRREAEFAVLHARRCLESIISSAAVEDSVGDEQSRDVREIFARLGKRFEAQASSLGVDLRFRPGRHAEKILKGAELVELAARELISNALANTRYGWIVVAARSIGGRVRIYVIDSGRGMPSQVIGRVFDDYYVIPEQLRAIHLDLPSHSLGLGRGLSRAKRSIEHIGGRLWLSSIEYRGTCAVIELPLQAAGSTSQSRLAGTSDAVMNLRGYTIGYLGVQRALYDRSSAYIRSTGASLVACHDRAALDELWRAVPNVLVVDSSDISAAELAAIVDQYRRIGNTRAAVLVLVQEVNELILSLAIRFDLLLLSDHFGRHELQALVAHALRLPDVNRDPTFSRRLMTEDIRWAKQRGRKPTGRGRLKRSAQKGYLLERVNDQEGRTGDELSRHIVLLHGGLSSAGGPFAAWLKPVVETRERVNRRALVLEATLPASVWRFDHDTFLPLEKSVLDLIRATSDGILAGAPQGKLVLVGHSRGGLVLRFAIPHLEAMFPGWRFLGVTAGTPHTGTDFFRDLGSRLSALSKFIDSVLVLGHDVVSRQTAAQMELVHRAFSYSLPQGLIDTEPSRLMTLTRRFRSAHRLAAFGGAMKSGRGQQAGSLLDLLIEQAGRDVQTSDGLVEVSSALGYGSSRWDVTPAFHTEYFNSGESRRQIESVMAEFFAEQDDE